MDRTEPLQHYVHHYLEPKGWLTSWQCGAPVDCAGPIPWYTYPCLKVLPQLIHPDFKVFEYGSGNSSLWWRRRAAQVVSVEHERAWAPPESPAHRVAIRAADSNKNADCFARLEPFFELGLREAAPPDPAARLRAGIACAPFRSYAAELLRYEPGFFDVIVVDGMARVLCAWLAAQRLKPGGFILFDNSDRTFYADAYALLRAAGFCRIDFWGTGPVNPYEWCTSIFTRNLEIFS